MISKGEILRRLAEGEEIVATFYTRKIQYRIGNDTITSKQFDKLYQFIKNDRIEPNGFTKHYYKLK